MTTPSIRETLLTFARDLPRASSAARDEADHIEDELSQLPALGFTQARRLLTDRRRELVDYATAMEAAAITRVALILGLRTGKDGECNIDKPPIWPKGPPTKAESAARGSAEGEPTAGPPAPTSSTGDPAADTALATAADAFMAAISDDRTPGQVRLVLSDLDWAVDEMSQYSDTALAYAAKHGLGPSQVTRMDDGGMRVDATGEVIP